MIKTAKIIFPDPIKHKIEMTDEMKNFIESLLDWDPSKWLGVNGAQEVKEHPWFKDFDFQKLVKKKIPAPYIPQSKISSSDMNTFEHLRSNETIIGSSKMDLIDKNKEKFANF